MSKLFWQMMISLDGLMEGPSGDIDWHVVDDDFNRYGAGMLASIDAILLGRKTYELFASYWPTAKDREAPALNGLPKIVFSKTLKNVDWNNSRLAGDDIEQEIATLKRESKKDVALFGSAQLGSDLMQRGLIDEIRLMVAPVVLGSGAPMFKDIRQQSNLKLTKTETFSSGVVLLYYQ
jgi:dihydrofolate reductase